MVHVGIVLRVTNIAEAVGDYTHHARVTLQVRDEEFRDLAAGYASDEDLDNYIADKDWDASDYQDSAQSLESTMVRVDYVNSPCNEHSKHNEM
eukprot:CFRG8376T1